MEAQERRSLTMPSRHQRPRLRCGLSHVKQDQGRCNSQELTTCSASLQRRLNGSNKDWLPGRDPADWFHDDERRQRTLNDYGK